jgi:hypothetical protein
VAREDIFFVKKERRKSRLVGKKGQKSRDFWGSLSPVEFQKNSFCVSLRRRKSEEEEEKKVYLPRAEARGHFRGAREQRGETLLCRCR